MAFQWAEYGVIRALAENYELKMDADGVDLMIDEVGDPTSMQLENGLGTPPKFETGRVIYEGVYPGINWIFTDKGKGNAGYDFVVAPGADPGQICLRFGGKLMPALSPAGELELLSGNRKILHSSPVTYQRINGERVEIQSAFRLEGKCLSFAVGTYDPNYRLVIDPTINLANGTLDMAYTQTACTESAPGVFEATYDITVNWINPPATGGITLSLTGNGTLNTIAIDNATIQGGTNAMLSGALTVPANGTGTIRIDAVFDDDPDCNASLSFKAPVPCPADVAACSGQAGCIGGNIFNDFNCDGTDAGSEEPGIPGIQVVIFDVENQAIDTIYSDDDGDWQSCLVSDGGMYRVEFNLPETLDCIYNPSHAGDDNHSNVQFVTAPACMEFSVSNPAQFCQVDPLVVVPCYTNGDPLDASNQDEPVIVSVQYSDNGGSTATTKSNVGFAQDLGTTWGSAWNAQDQLAYFATVAKRHVGVGPGGLGAIYAVSDLADPSTVSTLYTFSDAEVGPDVPDNTTRFTDSKGSSPTRLGDNIDSTMFSLAGTRGLGGIDISDDDGYLYVVNLYDRQVYSIDLQSTVGSGDATVLAGAPWVERDICSGGVARPWAVKVYNGKVYVGVVCDGSDLTTCNISDSCSDLTASIFSFDGNSWSTVISGISLDYDRNFYRNPAGVDASWHPWIHDYALIENLVDFEILGTVDYNYPQPILTAIEFDVDGSIIIGLADRSSFQFGYAAPDPLDASAGDISEFGFSAGDILRIGFDGMGNYVLENNGQVMDRFGNTLAGINTVSPEGPGGRGFYNDAWGQPGPFDDSDANLGGLAFLPGSGEVLFTASDAFSFYGAGLLKASNEDGAFTGGVQIFVDPNRGGGGTPAKAGGLGQLLIACNPAPLEIGNYVWCDSLQNGIQDASERGIDEMIVQLYDEAGTLVGQDTTANGGLYFFNQNNVDTTGVIIAAGIAAPNSGNWTGMDYKASYYLVYGDGQFGMDQFTLAGESYGITPMNDVNMNAHDNVDSDIDGSNLSTGLGGSIPDNLPYITVTTGEQGCADHNFDLGITCATVSLGNRVWSDLDGNGREETGEPGIMDVAVTLYSVASNGMGGLDTTLVYRDTTDANGYYLFDNLAPGTYFAAVDDGNFNPGQPLENQSGSPGTEVPVMDADSTDNGRDLTLPGYGIVSDTLTLSAGGEPNADYEHMPDGGSGIASDNASNLTVDFGFVSCSSPTADAATSMVGDCNGIVANDNAIVSINNINNADIAGISSAGVAGYDGPVYGTANGTTLIDVSGGSFSENSFMHGQDYVIRLFNGMNGCFTDLMIRTSVMDCSCTDPILMALTDETICSGESFTPANVTTSVTNAVDVTYQWFNDNGTDNPNADPIAGQTMAGLTAFPTTTGSFSYRVEATSILDGSCNAFATLTLTILPVPDITDLADQVICSGDSYELPSITGSNLTGNERYYTGPGGTGTELNEGDEVTTSQTIYLYDATTTAPVCSAEESFTVTVVPTPDITDLADQVICSGDSYELPSITGSNLTGNERYYTGPGGTGTELNEGDEVTTSQTIYLYDATATAPVCSAEESFTVTVVPTPDITDLADQVICSGDSYELPSITGSNLTGNERYYTGPGGTGTELNEGDEVTTSQTIYLYDATTTTPICSDEENFTVTVLDLDFGDLPDQSLGGAGAFPTRLTDDGARHCIPPNPEVYLGKTVDVESDGQPTNLSDGDDSADDEDGVFFVAPMIPGHETCIEVDAVNDLGTDVYLQGWIDFDGDGALDPAEELASGDFAGGGIAINPGGVSGQTYCFDVPADAAFTNGMAFARFRISSSGNLDYDGFAADGEVEDYKVNLGKIGNLVFEDYDFNGVQDAGEPGIDGVNVGLTWFGADGVEGGGDDVNYTDLVTGSGSFDSGEYYFCGLIEGTYKLIFTTPGEMTPTRTNTGTDNEIDSDGALTGMDMSVVMETFTIVDPALLPTSEEGNGDNGINPSGGFADAHTDETHDQGFALLDYGDLPANDPTAMNDGGAVHLVVDQLYLGATVDGEQDGQPSALADGDGDDEDGIVFVTPLVPGYEACIEVSAVNTTGADAVLQGWIDWDGNGMLDPEEELIFDNAGTVDGNLTGEVFCFEVPSEATMRLGMMMSRFRLSEAGNEAIGGPHLYEGNATLSQGEVEDYKLNLTKVGQWVWFDLDIDGIQDAEETGFGLNDLPVTLRFAGKDAEFFTADDLTYQTLTQNYTFADGSNVNGVYYFCGLIDGKYRLEVDYGVDSGLKPTLIDQGDDDFADNDGGEIAGPDGDPLEGITGMMFEVNNDTGNPLNENGIADTDPGNGSDPNAVGNWPDLQVDQSFDFGLEDPDMGDLPEGTGYDFYTTRANNGALHVIPPPQLYALIPYLYLGDAVDAEDDGQPATMADGDDLSDGQDDEDGVRLITPLVPGYEACVEVTVTMPEQPTGITAYLQGWIDFNGNGRLDGSEQVITDRPYGFDDADNGQPVEICFPVPQDAAFYKEGLAYARFRISTTAGLPAGGFAPDGEVEDYQFELVKIGNFVWEDVDLDGNQDLLEPGFNNIDVVLTFAGDDGTFSTGDERTYLTTTAALHGHDGQYSFCGLIPGNYNLKIVDGPPDFIPTVPNCSDDDLDSDGMPSVSLTIPENPSLSQAERGTGDNDDVTNFGDAQKDETYDFGYIPQAEIAASLAIRGVDFPQSEECGHFNVIFDGCIKNAGNLPLADLEALMDLTDPQFFGAAFRHVVNSAVLVSSDAQAVPVFNTDYNGTNDLLSGGGLLYPGEQFCFRLIIEVDPEMPGAPANPVIRTTAIGKAVNFEGKPIPDYSNGGQQLQVIDLSDSGLDPMSSNPGAAGDSGGYNDPTPLGDCWKRSRQISANDEINLTINTACEVFIDANMVVENFFRDCAMDLPLGSYYRVQLISADGGGVLTNPFDASQYAGRQVIFVVKSVSSHCVPFWGTINLEDKTSPDGCVRKVVGLHKEPVTYYQDADYFLTGNSAAEIRDTFYTYQPVTNEDAGCEDDILDYSYLEDSNTNLLICTDVDSILNVEASWTDPRYVYFTGTPGYADNCQGSSVHLVEVYDQLIDYDCDYGSPAENLSGHLVSQRIERTFIFEDGSGNRGEVMQEICFFKPIISLPDCKEYIDLCASGDLDEEQTEVELAPDVIHSAPYYLNAACQKMYLTGHACNVSATYEDQVLPGPDNCGFKVIRTWTILDWCWDGLLYDGPEGQVDLFANEHTGCAQLDYSSFFNKKVEYEQYLVVGDEELPVVLCPDPIAGADLVFSTTPFGCEGGFEVPAPYISNGECSYTWTVRIYSYLPVLWHGVPTGDFSLEENREALVYADNDEVNWSTRRVRVSNLPKGRHQLKYIVEDLCGNVGESNTCEFFVLDQTPPVAVCDDELTLSVSSGGNVENTGLGRIFASDIDEGSWDNCTEVWLQVRRFVPEHCVEEYQATAAVGLTPKKITIDKPGAQVDGQTGYWTVWADYLDVVCCDAGTHREGGKVLVELGVWDNANMSTDEYGTPIYGDQVKPFVESGAAQEDNFNTCWLEVLIEDKIAPVCIPPHDLNLSCEDKPYDVFLPENGANWASLDSAQQLLLNNWFEQLQAEYNSYPVAADNCGAEISMVDVKFDIHCGAGTITRFFQAVDPRGQTSSACTQIIRLQRHHNYCIRFPRDIESHCTEELAGNPGVELTEYGCDLLAVSVRDETFNVPGGDGSCFKVFRTYRVLNWCQFDEDVDPGTPLFDRFDSTFDLQPLIVGRDEDEDGIPGDEDVYVSFVGWEYDADRKNEIERVYDAYGLTDYVIGDADTEGYSFIGRNCDPADHEHYDPAEGYFRAIDYSSGFYQYTQVIKVFDNTPPVVVPTGEERFPAANNLSKEEKDESFANGLPTACVAEIARQIEVTEACSADQVAIESVHLIPNHELGLGSLLLYSAGNLTTAAADFEFEISDGEPVDTSGITRFVLRGTFPIGDHHFDVRVIDGCGNVDTENVPFSVYDDKAPSPICYASLSVELMPDGEGGGAMTVWADEFAASEIWDCSEPITYTLYRADLVDSLERTGEELTPDIDAEASLTVTCNDPELVRIYVYAWDAAGKGDRCESLLLINDFMGLCGPEPQATIAGLIATEDDRPLAGVEVLLSGASQAEVTTDLAGNYQFSISEPGYDYTVTPLKDSDHKNGVSTLDIVVMSKHILGIRPLESPYKMIAADVNNSGAITALDMIQLRKLIMSIDNEFRHSTSWRFVDAYYEFKDKTNPWEEPVPEIININNLEEHLINVDFVAVKIGDLTGDAVVNELEVQPRNFRDTFRVHVMDRSLSAGQIERVTFHAPDLEEIQGYQFTLNLSDGIELLNVEYGQAGEKNFGLTHLDQGSITSSWNRPSGASIDPDSTALFTLLLRAEKTIDMVDAISVGSRFTAAEAYSFADRLMNVQLVLEPEEIVDQFRLYQNKPNPFSTETMIGFYLPRPAAVTLTVHDVNGKVLRVVRRDFGRGYNELRMDGKQLPEGVLYYSLQTKGFQATRNMLIVKD